MATEKMYDLALQFEQDKLWIHLLDDEIFAVRFPDGETGYCSVLGRMGTACGLRLYVGDKGYRSLRLMMAAAEMEMDDPARNLVLGSNESITCTFDSGMNLTGEEREEFRKYARAHKIYISGENAYPCFTKCRTGSVPRKLESEEDEQRICEALSAAVALREMLFQYGKSRLKLVSVDERTQSIPIFVREDGRWTVELAQLPPAVMAYPEPVFTDEAASERLKRKEKRGIWECGMMWLPITVKGEDEVPAHPLALISVDRTERRTWPPVVTYDEDSAELMEGFAQELAASTVLPETICCGDDRSAALLKNLGAGVGIRIERTAGLETLGRVMREIEENISEIGNDETENGQRDEVIRVLMQMEDDELLRLPRSYTGGLVQLAETEELPEELRKRIRRLFQP